VRPHVPDQKLAESHGFPIRRRPVRGAAMQASKLQEQLDNFDTFQHLNCRTAIRDGKARRPANGT
jgi:hypothetical protein